MQRALVLSLVLSLVVAACGDEGNSGRLADAPPTNDAAVRTVVLTVTNREAPQPGVRVYFLGPDDAVIASAETDASGNAAAEMPSGGSVTAIDPFPRSAAAAAAIADNLNELRTFLGVKPGDHLYLTGNPTAVNITVRAPVFDGAQTYELRTTCGSSSIARTGGGNGSGSQDPGGPVTLVGCNGTANVMVLAFLPEKSWPSGALYRADVSVNEGLILDFTGDAYQSLADSQVTFSYTGAPEGPSELGVGYSLTTSRGVLDLGRPASPPIAGGAATKTVQEPALSGARVVVVTDAQLQARHQIIDWGAPSTRYALDLGTALLPDITSSPPVFDPATQRLTWTEAPATGPVPDLAAASLSVTRSNPSTESSRTWHWEIAGAHAAEGLKLPRLPTELLDWAPRASDSVSPETVVIAKLPDGYDAARPRIFDVRDGVSSPGAFSFAGAIAGDSGRALTAESRSPGLRAAQHGR